MPRCIVRYPAWAFQGFIMPYFVHGAQVKKKVVKYGVTQEAFNSHIEESTGPPGHSNLGNIEVRGTYLLCNDLPSYLYSKVYPLKSTLPEVCSLHLGRAGHPWIHRGHLEYCSQVKTWNEVAIFANYALLDYNSTEIYLSIHLIVCNLRITFYRLVLFFNISSKCYKLSQPYPKLRLRSFKWKYSPASVRSLICLGYPVSDQRVIKMPKGSQHTLMMVRINE